MCIVLKQLALCFLDSFLNPHYIVMNGIPLVPLMTFCRLSTSLGFMHHLHHRRTRPVHRVTAQTLLSELYLIPWVLRSHLSPSLQQWCRNVYGDQNMGITIGVCASGSASSHRFEIMPILRQRYLSPLDCRIRDLLRDSERRASEEG